jgi:hypothetical protein
MLPSSPNIGQNTNLTNRNNNLNINDFTLNTNIKQQVQKQPFIQIENSSQQKSFQLNFTNIMKNNENYEISLASNNNTGMNSALYSQTQRSLMQNPMVLNPEQFNNSNIKGSKLNEISNAFNVNISQEKLKNVN